MAETGIKRELKKKWGLSYFLIMMIPLILFLVFAMASIHTVRNSVDKSNTAALSALSNELNSAFMEVDALCEELILTDDFTVFSSRSLQDFDTYSLYLDERTEYDFHTIFFSQSEIWRVFRSWFWL